MKEQPTTHTWNMDDFPELLIGVLVFLGIFGEFVFYVLVRFSTHTASARRNSAQVLAVVGLPFLAWIGIRRNLLPDSIDSPYLPGWSLFVCLWAACLVAGFSSHEHRISQIVERLESRPLFRRRWLFCMLSAWATVLIAIGVFAPGHGFWLMLIGSVAFLSWGIVCVAALVDSSWRQCVLSLSFPALIATACLRRHAIGAMLIALHGFWFAALQA